MKQNRLLSCNSKIIGGLNEVGKLVPHHHRVSSVGLSESKGFSLVMALVQVVWWYASIWPFLQCLWPWGRALSWPQIQSAGLQHPSLWLEHGELGLTGPCWLGVQIMWKDGKVANWNTFKTTVLCGVMVLEWDDWVSKMSSHWK